jgi:cytochrome-b5 reductase
MSQHISTGELWTNVIFWQSKLPAPASDIKIMICGPPPMVSAMKKAIESLGYKKPQPVSKLDDQVFCF